MDGLLGGFVRSKERPVMRWARLEDLDAQSGIRAFSAQYLRNERSGSWRCGLPCLVVIGANPKSGAEDESQR